jgi:hypothetical protein
VVWLCRSVRTEDRHARQAGQPGRPDAAAAALLRGHDRPVHPERTPGARGCERGVSIVCTAVLAEISLCHACSCHEISRVTNGAAGERPHGAILHLRTGPGGDQEGHAPTAPHHGMDCLQLSASGGGGGGGGGGAWLDWRPVCHSAAAQRRFLGHGCRNQGSRQRGGSGGSRRRRRRRRRPWRRPARAESPGWRWADRFYYYYYYFGEF